MQRKKIKRVIRYFFARLLLRTAVALVYFIPFSLFRHIGILLSRIFYRISDHYRELALNNLRVVFPKMKEKERSSILHRSSVFLGANIADTLCFLANHRRKGLAVLEQREILDYALNCNKGVIGVTAHIGAFTILGGVLTEHGYPVSYILRTPRDEKMANVLGRGLRMQGVKPIFTKPAVRCVEKAIESLRCNEILIILIDHETGDAGVFVKFFDRYTSAPAGPIILSLRTGAKIIPMFMVRKNQRHNLLIYPEFKPAYKKNMEETIFDNTQNLILLVQEVIRKYPEQWSWIGQRWRIPMTKNK